MKPKSKAVLTGATGTVLGVAGLALLAMPAGAGEAPPSLPQISAEDLTQSIMTAKAPAMTGTVKVDQSLGLPAMPGGSGANPLSVQSGRVWSDGNGATRFAAQTNGGEQTVVHNGPTVWSYDSTKKSAEKITIPADADKGHGTAGNGQLTDPAAAAAALIGKIKESSNVTVDGTATVAGRSAYELVLSPKPQERTLLREIRVAVDSETRMPLRLSVLTNGTTDPALQMAFTDVQFGQQSADLFQFTPPAGTNVTEKQPNAEDKKTAEAMAADSKLVGDGWDSVLVGKIPADALNKQLPGKPGANGGKPADPKALLEQISQPVSGPFGNGRVVTTKAVTAILADDGRIAVGAVPQQVLIDALSAK